MPSIHKAPKSKVVKYKVYDEELPDLVRLLVPNAVCKSPHAGSFFILPTKKSKWQEQFGMGDDATSAWEQAACLLNLLAFDVDTLILNTDKVSYTEKDGYSIRAVKHAPCPAQPTIHPIAIKDSRPEAKDVPPEPLDSLLSDPRQPIKFRLSVRNASSIVPKLVAEARLQNRSLGNMLDQILCERYKIK